MKITDNSVVPLGWVLSGFSVMLSITIVGSFWVSAVNFRLQRIEEKLGIPIYQSAATFEKDAAAVSLKKLHGHE